MTMHKHFTWARLLRSIVALMLVFSLFLCGCTGVPDEGSKNNGPADNHSTLENGKLEAQDAVESISAVYGLLRKLLSGDLELGGAKDLAMQSEIALSLGEEIKTQLGQSLVQMGLPQGLSWFESVGIAVNGNVKDDKLHMGMDAKINGESIVGVHIIMDMLSNMLYASLPGLNDQTIGMPMDTMAQPAPDIDEDMEEMPAVGGEAMGAAGILAMLMNGDLTEVFAAHTELVQALPTEQQVNMLLGSYMELVLEHMDQGTTTQQTLSKLDISQNVDATTYVITRYDVMDVAAAVMTKAKTDTELEKALDAFSALINAVIAQQGEDVEPVDLHAELLDTVTDALKDVQTSKENSEAAAALRLCVSTADDQTVGLRLTVPAQEDESERSMTVYSLENGDKTAFCLNVADSFEVSGSGTIKNGKTSGVYSLILDGVERLMVELKDFTADPLNSDTLEGTVRFHLGNTLNDYVEPNVFLNENTVFELYLKIDDTGVQMQWKLYLGEMMLVTLRIDTKIMEAKPIIVPDDAIDGTDQQALMTWLNDMDLDQILANVRNAGVPDTLVQMLLQMLESGFSGGEEVYPLEY